MLLFEFITLDGVVFFGVLFWFDFEFDDSELTSGVLIWRVFFLG